LDLTTENATALLSQYLSSRTNLEMVGSEAPKEVKFIPFHITIGGKVLAIPISIDSVNNFGNFVSPEIEFQKFYLPNQSNYPISLGIEREGVLVVASTKTPLDYSAMPQSWIVTTYDVPQLSWVASSDEDLASKIQTALRLTKLASIEGLIPEIGGPPYRIEGIHNIYFHRLLHI